MGTYEHVTRAATLSERPTASQVPEYQQRSLLIDLLPVFLVLGLPAEVIA